jgi:hypothetical protein
MKEGGGYERGVYDIWVKYNTPNIDLVDFILFDSIKLIA